jgi:type II secretory pathway predicted ATPase ExeA
MYEAFYRLSSRPFLTVPDPEFLFWAEGHTLAFTMLRYGLMSRAPITVITGDIGSGKTTLLRQLLREVPADLEVGLVSNMQAGRGHLLQWVMMAFGQPSGEMTYVDLFARFQDHVIARYAAGKRVVLIFDEAQNLGVEALEELRMLSNINADKDELLQIVLVGQPQLRDLLARPELVQFSQRISSDFHLTPMSSTEVHAYIQHRLQVAGAAWRIFPERTCNLIHAATGGVPRLVNILCDLCLVYGFSADRKVIEEPLLREFLSSARRRGIYQQFRPLPEAPTLVHTAGQ